MKRIYDFIKQWLDEIGNRSLGAYSAQAAFFLFISFIPLVILLFSIINLIPWLNTEIISKATEFAPGFLAELITDAVSQASRLSSTAVISLSGLTALWAASKGIYAIVQGLDSAYGVAETRNPVLLRIKATLYTFCFVLLLSASLGLLVFGNGILERLVALIPSAVGAAWFVKSFRFVILLVVCFFFFVLTYKVLPDRKHTLVSVFPGALVASLGWLAFSFFYSLYIDSYNQTTSVYGSLTAIVLLLLWLYFCMYILMFGALLNSGFTGKGRRFVGFSKQ